MTSESGKTKDASVAFDDLVRRLLKTPPDHLRRTKTGAPRKEPKEKKPAD